MEIQELWEKIQGEFGKVNTRLDKVETKVESMDTRLGNVETKVGSMDTRLGNVEIKVESMDTRLSKVEVEVKEIKNENKGIRQELTKINEKLDVMQNSNLANILNNQKDISDRLKTAIEINNAEHKEFKFRHERVEKALGIA